MKENLQATDTVIKTFLEMVSPMMEIYIKEMYLFGSRCRDDWRPDSDYDILIVLERKDRLVIDKLYDAVIEILLSTGRLVSLKIFTLSEFNRLRSLHTPFIRNVLNEGMRIGTHN